MFPPEVNSTRMYSGAGSAPMSLAAAAWEALAGELEAFANGYDIALDELHGTSWHGGSADAMAVAVRPYIAWARRTAAQATDTAGRARAAAAAFEAAHAATVPPPVVAANRAALTTLVATNFLGQNTPAIAANEAGYAAMWAQDAAAMHGYAAASAQAMQLTPQSQPPQTTKSAPQSPAGAYQFIHSWLQTLSPVEKLGSYQYNSALTAADVSEYSGINAVWGRRMFLPAATPALWGNYALGGSSGAVASTPMASAGLARSATIGPLSVPQSWLAAAENGAADTVSAPIRLAANVTPLPTPNAAPIPPLAASPPRGRQEPAAVMKTPNRRFQMPRYTACG